jgi:hypothetical protein
MEPPNGDLIERLGRLERQHAKLQCSNRRLRIMTGAAVLFCSAIVLMAQTNPQISDSLDARQFVLHDSSGKVRAALGMTDDGAVGIDLIDSNDRTRVTLDVASNGTPGLDFFDQDGKMRGTFAMGSAGNAGFGLYGPEGHLRTSIDVPAGKTAGLAFYNQEGKPAWGAP